MKMGSEVSVTTPSLGTAGLANRGRARSSHSLHTEHGANTGGESLRRHLSRIPPCGPAAGLCPHLPGCQPPENRLPPSLTSPPPHCVLWSGVGFLRLLCLCGLLLLPGPLHLHPHLSGVHPSWMAGPAGVSLSTGSGHRPRVSAASPPCGAGTRHREKVAIHVAGEMG